MVISSAACEGDNIKLHVTYGKRKILRTLGGRRWDHKSEIKVDEVIAFCDIHPMNNVGESKRPLSDCTIRK